MNIIPTQELKDFILSQPDDRPINMKETQPDCSCGCILIQFQKEKGLPPATVGYTFMGNDNAFPEEVEAFIYTAVKRCITTYAQAKALLAEILP